MGFSQIKKKNTGFIKDSVYYFFHSVMTSYLHCFSILQQQQLELQENNHPEENDPIRSDTTTTVTHTNNVTTRICKLLPIDYELDDNDVLCGRGKHCVHHKGNYRFRTMIIDNLDRYNTAENRLKKTNVIYEIVDSVRHLCQSTGHGIGFVKKNNFVGRYYEVGDRVAVRLYNNNFFAFLNCLTIIPEMFLTICFNAFPFSFSIQIIVVCSERKFHKLFVTQTVEDISSVVWYQHHVMIV
jgi:hypothetical protein